MTVVFSDGETLTVPGFFPGGGGGAIQFEVTRPGGGTVESAFVDFNGGGPNALLTISEGDCIEDPDQIPEITAMTDVATDVNGGGATLNGSLMTVGDPFPVEVFFQYRVAGEAAWEPTGATTLTAPGPFSVTIDGLALDTTYEYRAVAVAADGTTSTGAIMQFTKSAEPVMDPVVFTGPATEINESTATLNGELVELGDFSPVNVFFEYRIVGNNDWLETAPQPFTAPGPFNAEVDVEPGNDYEYRAVAVADGVRIEGLTQTFTKPLLPPEEELPTVGTEPATEVNEATATANGVLVDPGTFGEVEVFFEYRLVGVEDWSETIPPETLTAPGPFSAEIPGLTEGLEYEYRAVAVANDSVVVGPIQRFAKVEPPVDPPEEPDDPPVDPPEEPDDPPVDPPEEPDDPPVDPPEEPDDPPVDPPEEPDDPPVDPPEEPDDPPVDPPEEPDDPPVDPPEEPDDPPVDPPEEPDDPPVDPPEEPDDPPVDPPEEPDDPPVDPPEEPDDPPVDPPEEPDDPPVDPPEEPDDPPVDPPEEPPFEPPIQPPIEPPFEPPVTPPFDPPETIPIEPPIVVDLPTVGTEPATDVNEFSATLNATVTDLGQFPTVTAGFEYRAVGIDTWLTTDTVSLEEPGSISIEVTNLEQGVQYEFRPVIITDAITIRGDLETFVKDEPDIVLPAIGTDPATNVNESSATLNATLETLGDFATVDTSFQYRVAGTETWLETDVISRTEPGSFAADIDGLEFGIRYEFRAVVEVDNLLIVGEIQSFTKGLPEPIPAPKPLPVPSIEPTPVMLPAPVEIRKPPKRKRETKRKPQTK
ncbi:hypothetical protein C500_06521 [Natrialba magadii ATCC 43099]|uniref:Fibronectin type III domain-containing protein n=1 Tax=Natrialba magadii (strain ATCC 43099 / DSM 3394 / CCM 3739 / CIP 104546 / IAM 13178 / JCM 8861 / NBRC 102185 / NCIMB 2190 / MS3) TaxID=547559 RepID=D3SZS2_NATMM|nr:hypothetical protein [Natrialba magadii]ELY31234.1 hypothetical protein C500_06521 [Natrialba magadii ATCC 43099]